MLPHRWTWEDDCELTLRLLDAGRLMVAPMISTVYPWRQAAAAYEHLRRQDDENLGILFAWKNAEGADG